MQDAARSVRRTDDHRYAYRRVLLDAPLGRVAATDGVNLLVHGGFGWSAPAAVAGPAAGVWAARLRGRASDAEIGYRLLLDAAGTAAAPAAPARDAAPAKAWYETEAGKRAAAFGGLAWLKSGGAKVVGVVVLAVIAGAAAWARKAATRTRR